MRRRGKRNGGRTRWADQAATDSCALAAHVHSSKSQVHPTPVGPVSVSQASQAGLRSKPDNAKARPATAPPGAKDRGKPKQTQVEPDTVQLATWQPEPQPATAQLDGELQPEPQPESEPQLQPELELEPESKLSEQESSFVDEGIQRAIQKTEAKESISGGGETTAPPLVLSEQSFLGGMTKANTAVGGSFQGDHVVLLPSGDSGGSAPRHSGAVSDRSRRSASPFDGSSGGSTGRAITTNGSGDIRCTTGEGGEKTRSGKKSRRIPLDAATGISTSSQWKGQPPLSASGGGPGFGTSADAETVSATGRALNTTSEREGRAPSPLDPASPAWRENNRATTTTTTDDTGASNGYKQTKLNFAANAWLHGSDEKSAALAKWVEHTNAPSSNHIIFGQAPASSIMSPMGVDLGPLYNAARRKQCNQVGHKSRSFTRPGSAGSPSPGSPSFGNASPPRATIQQRPGSAGAPLYAAARKKGARQGPEEVGTWNPEISQLPHTQRAATTTTARAKSSTSERQRAQRPQSARLPSGSSAVLARTDRLTSTASAAAASASTARSGSAGLQQQEPPPPLSAASQAAATATGTPISAPDRSTSTQRHTGESADERRLRLAEEAALNYSRWQAGWQVKQWQRTDSTTDREKLSNLLQKMKAPPQRRVK